MLIGWLRSDKQALFTFIKLIRQMCALRVQFLKIFSIVKEINSIFGFCVVHTEKIIHPSAGENGGYQPCYFTP